MIPYQGVEREVFLEAIRTIPAVAAAHQRDANDDALALLNGYLEDAARLGVSERLAWSILASAGMTWSRQLFIELAEEREQTTAEVIDSAVAATVDWLESGVR